MTLLVTSLASGSDGNALLLRCGPSALLVDCGLPLKRIEPLLGYAGVHPSDLCAVLLTHEHGDHAQGAGTLARRYGVPVVCNSETRAALGGRRGHVPLEELLPGERASIGAFDVCSFAVPHDAAAPVGYCLSTEGVTVGVAVDLGSWTDEIVRHLRRADLLVVEANHHPEHLLASSYPWSVCQRIAGPRGHLANQQAGELLAQIGADGRWRDVRLAHLSQRANTPAQARKRVRQVLTEAGITSMDVQVLPRLAVPTRKGMACWSSDSLFRQMDLFGSS
jgi:phosphoribosyl 1,2-cyclic phosphodiesterase